MKKSIFVVALLVVGACPPVWAQHSHINLIGPAEDMTLMMAFPAGMPSGFPNTYRATPAGIYDPNTGPQGTVTWTETFTGQTQSGSFMPCNVFHTPKSYIGFGSVPKDGTTGPSVNDCTYMNWTYARSFDLEGSCPDPDNCDGQSTDEIVCPLAGAFFTLLHGMEFEIATTTFQIPFDPNGGQQPGKVYCSDESVAPNPPGVDWPGLYQKTADKFNATYYRAQTGCFRFCANPPCTGQLWTCPGAVRQDKLIAKGGTPTKLDCTHKDAGYITGKNVTY